jgi:hypothetical protein
MRECVSDWPFLPRGYPDLTTDDTPLRHPHSTLVRPAVPSPTAGSGSLGLKPVSIPPPPPSTVPPAPPLRFQEPIRLVRRSPPPTAMVKSHADPASIDPFATPGDGSSRPPCLFKTTTVHDLGLPPTTTAAPGPRIKPLLEVFSTAVNGSPRAVLLNKTTTVHDPASLALDHGLP